MQIRDSNNASCWKAAADTGQTQTDPAAASPTRRDGDRERERETRLLLFDRVCVFVCGYGVEVVVDRKKMLVRFFRLDVVAV